ncbi:MAG: hypothetical protein ACYSTI_12785 [Planctomycetota bacterium]|jgi:hypothetical protein
MSHIPGHEDKGSLRGFLEGLIGGRRFVDRERDLQDEERREFEREQELQRSRALQNLPFFAEQLTGIDSGLESDPTATSLLREPTAEREVAAETIPLREVAPEETDAFSAILAPFDLGPSIEAETRTSAAALSKSRLRVEEAEFQRGLDRKIREIEATAPIEAEFAIQQAVDQFEALLSSKTRFNEKMALFDHNLALQRIQAQKTGSPSPEDTFTALILSKAQNLATDPTFSALDPQQWKTHVLARVKQTWESAGLEMPDLGTVTQALNEAARFYHPALKRIGREEETLDIQDAIRQLSE